MSLPNETLDSSVKLYFLGEFKCLIVGNSEVGKTSYIFKLLHGSFNAKYIRTQNGTKYCPVVFNTSRGLVSFELMETAGKHSGSEVIHSDYYKHKDCTIIMIESLDPDRYGTVIKWHGSLLEGNKVLQHKDTPVVVVATKDDLEATKDKPKMSGVHIFSRVRVNGLEYVRISSKTGENIHFPLLVLAQELLEDGDLEFLPLTRNHKRDLNGMGYVMFR